MSLLDPLISLTILGIMLSSSLQSQNRLRYAAIRKIDIQNFSLLNLECHLQPLDSGQKLKICNARKSKNAPGGSNSKSDFSVILLD